MATNRKIKRHSKKAGLPPGTLVHIGEEKTEQIRITLIDYNEQNFQEREVERVEECFPFKEMPTVTWINIDGLHSIETIEKIGIDTIGFDLGSGQSWRAVYVRKAYECDFWK